MLLCKNTGRHLAMYKHKQCVTLVWTFPDLMN